MELDLYQPEFFGQAECRVTKREVFQQIITTDYYGKIGRSPEGRSEYKELKAIGRKVCGVCPVTVECNEYGEKNKLAGMYGGTTLRERRNRRNNMVNTRNRGRS